ncbi:MAG: transcription antitermination factor NusB [Zoogloeaceae bacterium]|jgi:N utilization substance protein B|nr:transcription antitermination factor NusB [Zoogloeaceae bacterium]
MSKKNPPPDRSRARALAMQSIYHWRVGSADEASVEAHLADMASGQWEEESKPRRRAADMTLALDLTRGVMREHATLTEQLSGVLDRPFSGLSQVEAAILLMAACEMTHCPETPYRVIINEAIELAKSFGSEEGHRYVNGVLDRLADKLRSAERSLKQPPV